MICHFIQGVTNRCPIDSKTRPARIIFVLLFLASMIALNLTMHLNLAEPDLEAVPRAWARAGIPPHHGDLIASSTISQSVGNLDVAVVLDTTGSMEFDTICYGCWARCSSPGEVSWNKSWSNSRFIPASGPGSCDHDDIYKPYPENGQAFPFPYPPSGGTPTTDEARMLTLITGNGGDDTVWPPVAGEPKASTIGSTKYILLEAEFYKNNFSSWDPGARLAGKGYWAIQRNRSAKAYAIDGYGYGGRTNFSNDYLSGLVRHHPFYEENGGNPFGHCYTQAEVEGNKAPRLDYDFIPGWSTTTYIYIRAQYFNDNDCTALGSTAAERRSVIYWAVDDGEPAVARAARSSGSREANFGTNGLYGWVALPAVSLGSADVRHTLKIWAGSPGVSLDRIIITDQSSVSSPEELRDLAATPGSAQGLAADPCNPIFGLTVSSSTCTYMFLSQPVNNLNDPLFSDIEPIRGAQEAVRKFTTHLDPRVDQIGLVNFAQDGWQRAQLECVQAGRARTLDVGTGNQMANYPLDASVYGEYDELTCFDPAQAAPGTVPISYTNVLISLEDAYPPGGNTDIADGLRRGLHLLGINTDNDDGNRHSNDCVWDWRNNWWKMPTKNGWGNVPGLDDASPIISHCGRDQTAQPVIVLLTDGAPTNSDPGDNADCKGWGDTNPPPYPGFPITDDKYECIMYYADIAAANGVPICTVGISTGVDQDLLQAVADRTNGQAYFVPFAVADIDTEAILNSCLSPLGADLAIAQTQPVTDNITAGWSITYTLAISNIGPVTPVTATVVNTWAPPEAITGVSAPGCDVDLVGGVITCTQLGLSAGFSSTFAFTFTTNQVYAGGMTNSASVTAADGLTDIRPANNNVGPLALTVFGETYLPIILKQSSGDSPSPPDDDPPAPNSVIVVRETGGDTVTEIPAGSDIDISISNHDANTEYAICFGGVNIGVVTTNEFGNGTLAAYTIPVSTPTGNTIVSSSLDGCLTSEAETTIAILEP